MEQTHKKNWTASILPDRAEKNKAHIEKKGVHECSSPPVNSGPAQQLGAEGTGAKQVETDSIKYNFKQQKTFTSLGES